MEKEKRTITLSLNKELHRKFKFYAVTQGQTMSRVLEEFITKALKEQYKKDYPDSIVTYEEGYKGF